MQFTCVACSNESTNPRRFAIGLVCRACAAFLRREEATFEEKALQFAEETARIKRAYQAVS
ncbi:MAG TPA: hypothetical protein VGJ60_07080 [Chloroflexota bacterium]|jgi:hypothetical protein